MLGFLYREMNRWNKNIEEELTLLIKDWLKQKGKTQKDLKEKLNASSERMPNIIEILRSEYASGGMPTIAGILCSIEEDWSNKNERIFERPSTDPFSQLDLLLEEINEDCET